MGTGVRNVPSGKKIFQRLTRTECVCVDYRSRRSTSSSSSGPTGRPNVVPDQKTVRGPKRDRFPYRNRCKSPFLSDFFLKSEPDVHRPARKVVRQKKRTDLQQRISGPMRCEPGPGFGQLNVRYQSQNPSKVGPKTSSGSLLRTRLMSTSGLLRSLALSSSCACGATCPAVSASIEG